MDVNEIFEKAVKNYPGGKEISKENFLLALRHFCENYQKLLLRHAELKSIDDEIIFDTDHKEFPNAQAKQIKFVNNTEAFNQQIYVILGCLVKLLTYLDKGKFNSFKLGSIRSFLKSIERNNTSDEIILSHINNLFHSVIYRDKFVDHTQTNPLHDWDLFRGEKTNFIMFWKSFETRQESLRNYDRYDSDLKRYVLKDTNFIAHGEFHAIFFTPSYINVIESLNFLIEFLLYE